MSRVAVGSLVVRESVEIGVTEFSTKTAKEEEEENVCA